MILKELGIESGSKVPNRDKVGKLKKSQVKKIAKQKLPDMRVSSDEAADAARHGNSSFDGRRHSRRLNMAQKSKRNQGDC